MIGGTRIGITDRTTCENCFMCWITPRLWASSVNVCNTESENMGRFLEAGWLSKVNAVSKKL